MPVLILRIVLLLLLLLVLVLVLVVVLFLLFLVLLLAPLAHGLLDQALLLLRRAPQGLAHGAELLDGYLDDFVGAVGVDVVVVRGD